MSFGWSEQSLSEKAEAFEKGNEVMYAWNDIQKSNWIPELNEFIELAINDEVLNKLFPFTSLYTLCFSRCTGYPYYTEDLPNITPKKYSNFCIPGYRSLSDSVTDNILVVSKNKTEPLGEGNAKEAMRIIRDNLPANIKPAVKGTADNKPI